MSKISTQSRAKSAPAKAPAKDPAGVKFWNPAFAPLEPDLVRPRTLRLKPNIERGLVILKDVLKKPINTMVNEAVGEYIERRTAQAVCEFTTTLAQLQAYRKSDPEFAIARAAFIDAEATYGKDDPMEGRIVHVERPAGTPAAARFVSRTRSEIIEAEASLPKIGARKRG